MTDQLASPGRLRELFSPASIALVGASDTSGWALNVYNSLRTGGFAGRFTPVHPRHPTAFGLATRSSLRALEEPADLAFVLAPTQAVEEVVYDAAAAGTRNLIILAAGFGEQGEEGRELERRLVDTAAAHGITLLGPNGLGFINATAHVAPYALTLSPPLIAGPVGVVLQSGALASAVLGFARGHSIGLSLLISMGNEGMVTTADVIDYLIDDEATRVIALFLEEIRQPARFAAQARRALAAGKPIVALKVGRSPAGQRVALAHTGAVAGDDAVVDAALRQLGVIRVRSLEELLVTAGLLGFAPPLTGRRMGVVTASGGACDVIADRAHEEGIEIPEFAPETVAALKAVLPPFTSPRNPLDVTGYGLAHLAGAARPITASLGAVSRDPNVDFVLNLGVVVPPVPPPDAAALEARLDEQVAIIAVSPVPVVPATTMCADLTEYSRGLLLPRRLHLLAGLDLGLTAIGHALRWQEKRQRLPAKSGEYPAQPGEDRPRWLQEQPSGVWPETAGRRLLELTGVPMVPAVLAESEVEAVAAATRLGYPVALKACAAGLAHKSDVGAVALGLSSPADVRRAYARIRRMAAEGVLVSPMRRGGHELLAGVTVDATFGPVLAVGLGGIWVEALRDVAMRVLPIDSSDAHEMLGELRAAPLLRGGRGEATVDLDRLAEVLLRLSQAVALVGPSLQALEVNPLWCRGDQVEGLDVLVVTALEDG